MDDRVEFVVAVNCGKCLLVSKNESQEFTLEDVGNDLLLTLDCSQESIFLRSQVLELFKSCSDFCFQGQVVATRSYDHGCDGIKVLEGILDPKYFVRLA